MTGIPKWADGRGDPRRRPLRSFGPEGEPPAGGRSAAADRRTTIFEAVELAAVRAEELVATRRGRPAVRGVTIVIIDFVDFDLFSDFQAAGVIRRCAVSGAWELVRSWGGSGDDVDLGETMGATVATLIRNEFREGLRIRVVSLIDRA